MALCTGVQNGIWSLVIFRQNDCANECIAALLANQQAVATKRHMTSLDVCTKTTNSHSNLYGRIHTHRALQWVTSGIQLCRALTQCCFAVVVAALLEGERYYMGRVGGQERGEKGEEKE